MVSERQKGNNRIFSNTIYLYLRKIFTLGVGLYTSRALLHYLGVDDYGLYGLVGSVIVLFGSLRVLFSTSIQRFINVETGRGNFERVNVVFSMGMKIQTAIALIFIAVIETAAFFILPTLNIPPEKLSVAWVILQFSMLTAAISMLTVPFDGLIISYEKFKIYAVFATIESVLKLGAVLSLALSPVLPVIFYAAMLLVVSLVMRLGLAIYCRQTFGEVARFRNVRDRQLMREMSGFAGWQFVGEMGYTVSQSGINFVLNLFGGVVANAAKAVATQVMGITITLADDLNLSFSPQIISTYSRGEFSRYRELAYLSFKTNFLAVIILCFPVFIMAPSLLKIWLVNVPENTITFIPGLLLYSIFLPFEFTFNILMKANGNIKKFQIIKALLMLSNIPISWLLLWFGAPLYIVFYVMTAIEISYISVLLIIGHDELQLPISAFLKNVAIPVCRSIVTLVCLIVISEHLRLNSYTSVIEVIVITISLFIIGVIASCSTVFSISQLKRIGTMIKVKVSK